MKILLTLLCLSVTCSYAQPRTPEEVGESVFQLLRELDEENFEDYLALHVTLTTLGEIASDTTVTDRVREDFGSVTEEVLRERYGEMHGELLIMESEIENFFWKDIQFKEFTYNDEEGDGLEGISGELTFTGHDVEYTLELAALHRNGAYSLFFIEYPYDFLNEEISEEELEQMIKELEELEDMDVEPAHENIPPPPMESFTISGTFKSVEGVMDPLSCHCSNGGYLTDEYNTTYAICLEDGKEVDCETIQVTGFMEEDHVTFDAENPCKSGLTYLMRPTSVICLE